MTGMGKVNRRSASAPPPLTSLVTSSGVEAPISFRSNPAEKRSDRPVMITALADVSAWSSAALSEASMVGLMALALPSSMVMTAISFSILIVALMAVSLFHAR